MLRKRNGLPILAALLMSAGLMSAVVVGTAGPASAVAYHMYYNPGVRDCIEGRATKEVYRAPCDGEWNQQWDWIDRAEGVSLKNRHHGTCLAIDIGAVVLRDCQATFISQRWERTGDGAWRNLYTNSCLYTDADFTRIATNSCTPFVGGHIWRDYPI
jgi:hypothetical protein